MEQSEKKFKGTPGGFIREYLIVTNDNDVLLRAMTLGYDKSIQIKSVLPSPFEVEEIKARKPRGCAFIMFLRDMNDFYALQRIRKEFEFYYCIQLYTNLVQIPTNGRIQEYKECDLYNDIEEFPVNMSHDRFVEVLDVILDEVDCWMENKGCILHERYNNYCGNCHRVFFGNEQYCSYCGTKRGEGSYNPFRTIFGCLNGSLDYITYRCDQCGREWREWEAENLDRYCPYCGNMAMRIGKSAFADPGHEKRGALYVGNHRYNDTEERLTLPMAYEIMKRNSRKPISLIYEFGCYYSGSWDGYINKITGDTEYIEPLNMLSASDKGHHVYYKQMFDDYIKCYKDNNSNRNVADLYSTSVYMLDLYINSEQEYYVSPADYAKLVSSWMEIEQILYADILNRVASDKDLIYPPCVLNKLDDPFYRIKPFMMKNGWTDDCLKKRWVRI